MARLFSIRPAITLKGRTNKGLRGLSGKPLHPPLTDIPVTAYLFALVFDLISYFSSGGFRVSTALVSKGPGQA